MKTESLYYIKDYSSNFYRVDPADQLVAAADQGEAMVFTFAQANDRIGAGKKAAFYQIIPVGEEVSEEKSVKSPMKAIMQHEISEPASKNIYSYRLSDIDWVEYVSHFIHLASGMQHINSGIRATMNEEITRRLGWNDIRTGMTRSPVIRITSGLSPCLPRPHRKSASS